MAVETKFVVVRKGEEKMTFASKKEADAYDKMLDMAEVFSDWLLQSGVALDEIQAENTGLFLAEQRDALQHILRTGKLPESAPNGIQEKPEIGELTTAPVEDDSVEEAAEGKRIRAVKAA